MSLSAELSKRGFIKDKTFEDVKYLDKPQTFYWGVDCSSNSMTIGNLAPLMLVRHLIESGWKAVILVGGATSLIGDPGGKDEERPLLPRAEVVKNVAAIEKQLTRFLSGEKYTLVDNYDWFKSVAYLDFLRDVGKHFSMTELTQREFITERMGEHGAGISYAEFSYSLIQGYDFWHLFQKHGAVLQVGGSDQWGNMLSGVSLIRKKEAKEANALSMPLVVNQATGKKFGKSEAGAVWLDPAKTSPTQFYQFWINVDDADAANLLKIYTLLPLEDIQKTMEYHVSNPEERKAQQLLAKAVTELVHGREDAHTAEVVTEVITGQKSASEVSEGIIAQVRKEIASEKVKAGTPVIDVLVAAGLAGSKSEARQLLAAGAVYVDGKTTSKDKFEEADFENGRLMLRRGKAYKDSALVELK